MGYKRSSPSRSSAASLFQTDQTLSNMATHATTSATTSDHAVDHGYQEKHAGNGAVSHMDQANLNRFITPGGNPVDNR